MSNATKGSDRIAFLKQKEREIRTKLAAEHVRQQKLKAKLEAREFAEVGEALCKYARQSPDFHLMLKQVLASAVTDDASRKFLAGRGWL